MAADITGTMRRQVDAVRVVFASRWLRDCQVSVALARSIDLAQLVAISAYLFESGGLRSVAAYGVVRTIAPAVGVPLVTAATGRIAHGRLLRLVALVAALASAGIVAIIVTGGPVTAVLVLTAVTGIGIGAFRPVTSALMPSLVRRPEELVACSAATGFLDSVTTLLGPLLAGVLLVVAGPAWAVGATVPLLVAAGLVIGGVPAPPVMAPGPSAGGSGFAALFSRPEAAVIGVLAPLQTFVRGALQVIVVVFVIEVLRLDDGAIGVLFAVMGVGGILALPAAVAFMGSRRLYRAFGLGLVLWGLPVAVTAGVPVYPAVLVLFAVIGVGNVLIDVSAYSVLPRAVPDRDLANAFGLLEALIQIGMALGAVAAGLLLEEFGAQVSLLVVGLLLPIAAAVAAPFLRRFDARLEHHDVEVSLLRRQPVFEELPMSVLDNLGGRMKPATFAAKDVIMREGDPGERYVLIVDGEVVFSQHGAEVNRLGDGAGFGEIALVRDTRRTATAVAGTAVNARTLDRDSFLAALCCDPRAWAAADAVADERLSRAPGQEPP